MGQWGLVLPQYELCAPAQRTNNLKRIAQSSDAKIRRMAEVYKLAEKFIDITNQTGLKLPKKLKTKVQWRPKLKQEWTKLNTCKSHKAHTLPQSNTWLDCRQTYFT
ncbi:hypothetical protein DPMN_162888 [Dreissena polymorpha]|uniref:Uncharacterized protein n=1 Tax=Dreissena polymorpha TaxID=45954 RepID=A0A9D4EVQ8_DREPO|nr:hypothetical protein DPMN_162888 [Dreissena polymorpha]